MIRLPTHLAPLRHCLSTLCPSHQTWALQLRLLRSNHPHPQQTRHHHNPQRCPSVRLPPLICPSPVLHRRGQRPRTQIVPRSHFLAQIRGCHMLQRMVMRTRSRCDGGQNGSVVAVKDLIEVANSRYGPLTQFCSGPTCSSRTTGWPDEPS
jgi:hypothetical protein